MSSYGTNECRWYPMPFKLRARSLQGHPACPAIHSHNSLFSGFSKHEYFSEFRVLCVCACFLLCSSCLFSTLFEKTQGPWFHAFMGFYMKAPSQRFLNKSQRHHNCHLGVGRHVPQSFTFAATFLQSLKRGMTECEQYLLGAIRIWQTRWCRWVYGSDQWSCSINLFILSPKLAIILRPFAFALLFIIFIHLNQARQLFVLIHNQTFQISNH